MFRFFSSFSIIRFSPTLLVLFHNKINVSKISLAQCIYKIDAKLERADADVIATLARYTIAYRTCAQILTNLGRFLEGV